MSVSGGSCADDLLEWSPGQEPGNLRAGVHSQHRISESKATTQHTVSTKATTKTNYAQRGVHLEIERTAFVPIGYDYDFECSLSCLAWWWIDTCLFTGKTWLPKIYLCSVMDAFAFDIIWMQLENVFACSRRCWLALDALSICVSSFLN